MIDFLGIGAQKSATSWLFQCLREHPMLCLAEEKELHYFSGDERFARGPEWYEAHWHICKPGAKRGEISTSYLASPEAPRRIKAYAPSVKLIAILRDPTDRAESHIRHLISKKEIGSDLSLAEILALRPDVFENGRYATHLARYEALFPCEQIHLETYEAVLREPAAVIGRVDDFLGVAQHTPKALLMRYNSSAFRATALHGAANRAHAFMKALPGGRLMLGALRRSGLTSARLANAGHRAGEGAALYTLSSAERTKLRELYADELAGLKERGISFS